MPNQDVETMIPGPAGRLQARWRGADRCRGIVFLAHPHSLQGGSMDNKVITTIARVFSDAGWAAAALNFRGVGKSEGVFDDGAGETEDFLALVRFGLSRAHGPVPVVFAGFSFGTFVISRAVQRFRPQGAILCGSAAGMWEMPSVAGRIDGRVLVIHGADDEIIPLRNVLEWAEPQGLPVSVIAGCPHLFHRKVHLVRSLAADYVRLAELERA